MNIWGILLIEPTQDKKMIRKAYAQQLRQTNPEDDPEGFQRLRAAYEEALQVAGDTDYWIEWHRLDEQTDTEIGDEQINAEGTGGTVDLSPHFETYHWIDPVILSDMEQTEEVPHSVEGEILSYSESYRWIAPSDLSVDDIDYQMNAPESSQGHSFEYSNVYRWINPSHTNFMDQVPNESPFQSDHKPLIEAIVEDAEYKKISEEVLVLAQARGIMEDIKLRTTPAVWEVWTQSEELWRLDVKFQTGVKLLQMLVQRPFLPKVIWTQLNDFFSWSEQQDKLKGLLPEETARYPVTVLERIHELRYDSFDFDRNVDYESFIRIRDKALQMMVQGSMVEAGVHIDVAMEIYAEDSDLLRLAGKFKLWNRDEKGAHMLFDRLTECEPETIDGWLHSARLLEAGGHLEQAFHLYNRVLELNPDHPDALNGLVRYYKCQSNEEEAIHILEKLVSLYPHDMETQITLIESRLTLIEVMNKAAEIEEDRRVRETIQHRVALEYMDFYGDEQVIQYISELHILNELNETLYVLWAQACIRRERNQEAMAILLLLAENSVNEAGNSEFEICFERGKLYIQMGNSAKAIPDLEKAIRLNKTNAEAWHSLAYACHLQAQNELCIQYSDKAIELDPDMYKYRSLRAHIYYNKEFYKEALLDYEHVDLSDGDYPFDWILKSITLLKLGRYEEAIQAFEASRNYDQSEEDLLEIPYYLSIAYARLGKTSKALEYIHQFRREKPDDSKGPLLEGDIFREQGSIQQAMSVYKNGFEEFPGEEELARMTIVCAMELDFQEKDAKLNVMAKKMIDMESLNPWLLLFVARYLVETQAWERYRSFVKGYLDDEPADNIDPRFWLYSGIVAYRTGNLDQALLELDKAYRGRLEGEACSYLSMVYYDMGNMEQALIYANKAIQEQPKHPDYLRRLEGMRAHVVHRKISFRNMFVRRKRAYEQWPSMVSLQHLVPQEPISLHFE